MDRALRARFALAALIGVTGLAVRLWLLGTPAGALNADEAYTGLQALAILDGDLPVVIRGAGYTAVLDSYAFAPFVALFGAHVVPLKLLSGLWWALAAVVAFATVKRLARALSWDTAWAPWLAAAMVWLAPGALMQISTRAYEAYGLGLLAVATTTWLVVRVLVDGIGSTRLVVVAGAAGGLAFYLHPMFAAVVVPLVAVPCWVHRRRLREWWLPAVGGAVLVNLPLLAWNARNGWPSLDEPSPAQDTYIERLGRFFSGLLPRAFGTMNADGEWTWGAVSVALYAVLMIVAAWGVVTLSRRGAVGRAVALPAVLCWPLLAAFSSLWYVADGRYAIVGFPFVVSVIVAGLVDLVRRVGWLSGWVTGAALVCAWPMLLVVPWLGSNAGGRVDDPNAGTQAIVDTLEAEGFGYAAGNYWLTLPVEYQSDRRIRTAVAGHPWGVVFPWQPKFPWGVRFAERQAEVLSQPSYDVAYVFLPGDEQVGALPLPVEEYERREVGGAVLYLP